MGIEASTDFDFEPYDLTKASKTLRRLWFWRKIDNYIGHKYEEETEIKVARYHQDVGNRQFWSWYRISIRQICIRCGHEKIQGTVFNPQAESVTVYRPLRKSI